MSIESAFELSWTAKTMIADIKKALDVMNDHWPSNNDDDLSQAYKLVEWDLRKNLVKLKEDV